MEYIAKDCCPTVEVIHDKNDVSITTWYGTTLPHDKTSWANDTYKAKKAYQATVPSPRKRSKENRQRTTSVYDTELARPEHNVWKDLVHTTDIRLVIGHCVQT